MPVTALGAELTPDSAAPKPGPVLGLSACSSRVAERSRPCEDPGPVKVLAPYLPRGPLHHPLPSAPRPGSSCPAPGPTVPATSATRMASFQ